MYTYYCENTALLCWKRRGAEKGETVWKKVYENVFLITTFKKKRELKRRNDIWIVQFSFLYRMKSEN